MNEKWPKYILLGLTDCADPQREEEFNDWYSHTHLPDLAEAHGLVNAVRYRNIKPGGGTPKYLAIYELNTDDPDSLFKELVAGDLERAKQGRFIDFISLAFSSTFERIDE